MKHIWRIANLITGDPDILVEEDEDGILRVIYQNVFGESTNLTIKRDQVYIGACADYHDYLMRELVDDSEKSYIPQSGRVEYFVVGWERGGVGSLIAEAIDEEGYQLLMNVAQSPSAWLNRQSDASRLDQRDASRLSRKLRLWQYMDETYGRCCPDWWMVGETVDPVNRAPGGRLDHTRGQEGCYANHYENRHDAETGKSDTSWIFGRHDSDYGSIRAEQKEDGIQVSWDVAGEEESEIFNSPEEVVEYLNSLGVG